MKKFAIMLALSASFLFADEPMKMQGMYQTVPDNQAEILQKGDSKMYCPNCGMYIPKYYKTSHLIKLKDGEVRQYCSIYCLVEECEITTLRDKKDQIDNIMVVDAQTLKYIDAKDAYYVIGSKIGGTMTLVSKYAFQDKATAEEFANKNGGKIGTYDEAYNISLNDFAKDTALVHKNRSSNMYAMGEKLYNSTCNKEMMEKFHTHTMADMKAMIKSSNACGDNLDDKSLQGIMLYFWDIKLKKFEELHGKNPEIQKLIQANSNMK